MYMIERGVLAFSLNEWEWSEVTIALAWIVSRNDIQASYEILSNQETIS